MQILTAVNQKGGVGKTCFIVLFAQYLAKKNKKILVIDLDTQGNASYSLDIFKSKKAKSENLFDDKLISLKDANNQNIVLLEASPALAGLNDVPKEAAYKVFKRALNDIKNENEFDYCLIDTAPVLGVSLFVALSVANFVISPIELEVYSLQGIEKITAMIANIQNTYNSELFFIGMLPSRVDNRIERQRVHLAELLEAYPNSVIPYPIYLRSCISDALATGTFVWDDKKTASRKTAKELDVLFGCIESSISKDGKI